MGGNKQEEDSEKSKKKNVAKAEPSKRFFVEMLTRDIELSDAVLDLLDNCVDGAMRTKAESKPTDKEMPYKGYFAEIAFSAGSFKIHDNCGGISRQLAVDSAFQLGRPESHQENLPTVGIYGIGMKRSIFKIGRQASVSSRTLTEHFQVDIPADWQSTNNWFFPITDKPLGDAAVGTSIEIAAIVPDIKTNLADPAFEKDLRTKIALHYSVILGKGFVVRINKTQVKPQETLLLSDLSDTSKPEQLAPFLYESKINGVSIKLAVGFYKPIPTADEVEEDTEARHTGDDAGWTIVCNDRIVVSKDKSILTGWGEADVPSYHPQFIAIAGVVEFSSADASKLPITTTKRGIDGGSALYLRAKQQMRRGTKLFTSYTNKWKKDLDTERTKRTGAKALTLAEVARVVPTQKWTKSTEKGDAEGRVYEPSLPKPKSAQDEKVIRFWKPLKHIEQVSKYLFEQSDGSPSEVGAACFDHVLKVSKEKKS